MPLRMGQWLNIKARFSKSNCTKEDKTGFMYFTKVLA